MSCRSLQDAVVDVARGRDVGAGTIGAVEAHLEHCASCRARFIREQQLSDGLQALARSTNSQGASASVEDIVLAAFTEQHGVRVERRSWSWMPAAAAIALLAASAGAWSWMTGRSSVEDVRTASIERPKPIETPALAAAEHRAPSAATSSPTVTDVPRRPVVSRRPQRAPSVVRPEGFVALPSAAGLPAFESGEIVRVEVPVTSLPMYGIDIAPDARGPAVEADFLVGQDGQARAIRLVRNGRL